MVEVVGSGLRVPAIIKMMTELFGKEPRRTMIASECVARGSALQCAILSPTFKVRSGTFTIDVLYADVSELQVPAKISTYTIGLSNVQQVIEQK
ncbi:Heat shock 70 kDa protein 15 [Euphorbia peplus]|nr:Heat shock 70 kDa protein 15 [Euphorbia peplus]